MRPNSDQYEAQLIGVAKKGLEAIELFLESAEDATPELRQQRHLKAKVGATVVASHVRYMSAVNNRELLRLQQAGEGTGPALLAR